MDCGLLYHVYTDNFPRKVILDIRGKSPPPNMVWYVVLRYALLMVWYAEVRYGTVLCGMVWVV